MTPDELKTLDPDEIKELSKRWRWGRSPQTPDQDPNVASEVGDECSCENCSCGPMFSSLPATEQAILKAYSVDNAAHGKLSDADNPFVVPAEVRDELQEKPPRWMRDYEEINWPGNRHPSSARFVERMGSLVDLHDQKQADYGTNSDPFANVREGAKELGLPGWVGVVIRMNDKMRRLNKAARQFIQEGEINLANEGVLDSFDDLAVYSQIGAVLFEES